LASAVSYPAGTGIQKPNREQCVDANMFSDNITTAENYRAMR